MLWWFLGSWPTFGTVRNMKAKKPQEALRTSWKCLKTFTKNGKFKRPHPHPHAAPFSVFLSLFLSLSHRHCRPKACMHALSTVDYWHTSSLIEPKQHVMLTCKDRQTTAKKNTTQRQNPKRYSEHAVHFINSQQTTAVDRKKWRNNKKESAPKRHM